MYLESLFQYLSKEHRNGMVSLTYSQIEKIIGGELSVSAKTHDSYWRSPKIRHLMKKHNVKFGYINTFSKIIYFEVL